MSNPDQTVVAKTAQYVQEIVIQHSSPYRSIAKLILNSGGDCEKFNQLAEQLLWDDCKVHTSIEHSHP